MVEIMLTSKNSGRVIKSSYTARQLLETDEIDIVMDMTKCDCQPVGETYVVECNCDDEWEQYELIIGEHDAEVKRLKNEIISLKEDLQHVHNISVRGLMRDDICTLEDVRNYTKDYCSC
ncbi:hypothetical protein ACOMCU_16200 [Lysinibacillus sp. UGB7]|uniref:hypothetical protein n=1 Tax=Lysinibacillus sp. UGB7 TaxID=3411039 RepID=UPI003B7BB6D0